MKQAPACPRSPRHTPPPCCCPALLHPTCPDCTVAQPGDEQWVTALAGQRGPPGYCSVAACGTEATTAGLPPPQRSPSCPAAAHLPHALAALPGGALLRMWAGWQGARVAAFVQHLLHATSVDCAERAAAAPPLHGMGGLAQAAAQVAAAVGPGLLTRGTPAAVRPAVAATGVSVEFCTRAVKAGGHACLNAMPVPFTTVCKDCFASALLHYALRLDIPHGKHSHGCATAQRAPHVPPCKANNTNGTTIRGFPADLAAALLQCRMTLATRALRLRALPALRHRTAATDCRCLCLPRPRALAAQRSCHAGPRTLPQSMQHWWLLSRARRACPARTLDFETESYACGDSACPWS